MKTLMMILALSAFSMTDASARELNEAFLLRHEAKQEQMAKEKNVPPLETKVPEQVCHEEKHHCDKC